MVPDPAQGGKDGVPEEGIPPGYTERTLEHLLTPRNLGMIPEPDGHALFTGPCGDTVEVFLQVADEQIEAASFLFHGCQHTLICGDAACELVKGKPVKEVFRISQQGIIDYLGGLPREQEHCANLAADAVKAALLDYLEHRKDPWKKTYRR